ncbi:MAG: hypothetical protein ACYC2Y_06920 [Armatimonadota bacterium]
MERELDHLLELIAEHIDPEHCRKVDERYRRALRYEEVDTPPLVVQAAFGETLELPEPWHEFKGYTYREAFDDPAAMMQNMLLARVVPGLILKDDNPLAIRNDHGTVQIASLLGGKWQLHRDNYPWVEPLGDVEALEKIAASTGLNVEAGVLGKSLDTLRFYNRKLSEHPALAECVQVSLPDLQGPMDTAEQLWGSGIYYAFADNPDLLARLLSRVVDAMIEVSEKYRECSRDRLDPFADTQHGYVIPGRLLIRNDSSLMLSPATYSEFVRPHDARLLKEVGTGSIHSCGNWGHLIHSALEIEDLRGVDFGNPELMDVAEAYRACSKRKVAMTNIKPSREDIMSGKAKKDFPTGVVFIYNTTSIEDAIEVLHKYKSV